MIKKTLYIFIFFSFTLCAQNNNLRIEMIDVFKEYTPSIKKSFKISKQPTFSDTLQTNILANKSILNKNLLFTEMMPLISSSQFRFIRSASDYQKYLSLSMGSKSFLNIKFHYTNGLSTQHNSGVYFEHDSEAYLINQNLDGEHATSLQAYSDWFLHEKSLSSVFRFDNNTGFYWADLDGYSTTDVTEYIGNNFEIKLNLDNHEKNNILNNANLNLNYFCNNSGRSEFLIKPSFSFALEQALRQYFFNVDAQINHTIFNPEDVLNFDNQFDNQFRPLEPLANVSDILINSKLLLSGNKFINYIIGCNFQYLLSNNMLHGRDPLLFPEILLSKNINKRQKVNLSISKKLIYNSFSELFSEIPYVDPYNRNSLLKQFKITFEHTAKLHDDISVSSDLNYIREHGSLIPFVLSKNTTHALSEFIMSPLAIYCDSLQSGIGLSTSVSLDKPLYNILLDGTFNFISSKKYNNKQFVPKFQFNSIVRLNITDDFNVISNFSWIGKRDFLVMNDIYHVQTNNATQKLDSHFQIDMSFSYHIKEIILSLECQNILGQKIDFYDGYYDDDGFKIHLGCAYRF